MEERWWVYGEYAPGTPASRGFPGGARTNEKATPAFRPGRQVEGGNGRRHLPPNSFVYLLVILCCRRGANLDFFTFLERRFNFVRRIAPPRAVARFLDALAHGQYSLIGAGAVLQHPIEPVIDAADLFAHVLDGGGDTMLGLDQAPVCIGLAPLC